MSVKKSLDAVRFINFPTHFDDVHKIVGAESGNKPHALLILVALDMRMGANGYYIKWTDETAALMADELGVDFQLIKKVVGLAIKRGIFNKAIFKSYKLLTNESAQITYKNSNGRKKNFHIDPKHLLIDIEEKETPQKENQPPSDAGDVTKKNKCHLDRKNKISSCSSCLKSQKCKLPFLEETAKINPPHTAEVLGYNWMNEEKATTDNDST